MYALEINGLSKTYRGKKGAEVRALTDLDLQVLPGEVFGFLGPNGAGKSTTIKTIMGQVQPSSGSARIFGIPVSSSSARRKVGYLPENPAFYDFMTAREYLLFVGRAHEMSQELIESRSLEMLRLMELTDAADRPIRGYSKGMVQRLGLAQALLPDPDLFILDEPMSGLDPLGRALVKEIIKDLKRQGKTVFFSTHITADVEVVCDKVGVIVKGKLQVVDRVENIQRRGIVGYYVQISGPDGAGEEQFVERERLKSYLKELAASDRDIERIEPKRKDLETFFLEVVARGENGEQ